MFASLDTCVAVTEVGVDVARPAWDTSAVASMVHRDLRRIVYSMCRCNSLEHQYRTKESFFHHDKKLTWTTSENTLWLCGTNCSDCRNIVDAECTNKGEFGYSQYGRSQWSYYWRFAIIMDYYNSTRE